MERSCRVHSGARILAAMQFLDRADILLELQETVDCARVAKTVAATIVTTSASA